MGGRGKGGKGLGKGGSLYNKRQRTYMEKMNEEDAKRFSEQYEQVLGDNVKYETILPEKGIEFVKFCLENFPEVLSANDDLIKEIGHKLSKSFDYDTLSEEEIEEARNELCEELVDEDHLISMFYDCCYIIYKLDRWLDSVDDEDTMYMIEQLYEMASLYVSSYQHCLKKQA